MNKLLPVIFAILVLTGTSGVQYSMAQAPDLSKPEFYKPDTLIVKFKPGISAEQQNAILSAQNSSVIDELELLKIKIISVPESALDAVQTALSKNKSVEYAEYVEGARPSLAPNDTYYLQNYQWYLDTINAEEAWDITKGGDFPILILDSGIDMDHPDLASKIIAELAYDANNLSNPNPNDLSQCGHGTGVAGNAAAATDNDIGIAQIGWDTKIISVKITDDSDPDCLGWSDAVLRGVEHGVLNGAKVANLSYGFSGGSYHIQAAADLLRANNGWLLISAGNSGGLSTKTDYPHIIFVSSTNADDALSGFSSYGNYVDISSPGSSILLTTNGGGYSYWGGTSMAAPLAAATLNLLYSIDPTLTSDEAFNILKNSAVDLGCEGWDPLFGHGRINAGAAALAASGSPYYPPTSGTLDIRIGCSSDDAEEQIYSGTMDLSSTDIEIGDDPGLNEDQLAGLRFTNIGVPQGATITSAYIEFTVDETDTESTSVTIKAQDTDNASTFTSSLDNISSRTTTSASVAWNNISSWNAVGTTQQSPDISSVIQEVVDRNGWSHGNSLAIIIDGSGSRTSESYDGSSASAPLLHIEYDNSSTLSPSVTPENFKVAFIGDQGVNSNSESVLQLIANEGAGMVLHSGDLDYAQDPTRWNNQINAFLGPSFPYFVSVGNHDIEVAGQWDGYQGFLQQRLDLIPDATCVGDLGVMSSCHYQGLFFILSGVGTLNTYTETQYVNHITTELANDDSVWSICSWHKNQNAMQVGSKSNEVGWNAYEACKDGGAIIATAHEHSYERTKTLTNTQTQTVDATWPESNDVRVAEGSTFAFVSGLGGQSIRNQDRCSPDDYPYGCSEWANIYTSNQGANHGALFCDFNVDGQEDRAYCYFKNIGGNVIDSFYVTSFMGNPNTSTPANNAPISSSDSISTDKNVPVGFNLSASDSNGDSLAYSIVSTPANGSISGTGPYLIYTPDLNFVGNDSFTFKTNDGEFDSNTATLSITVNGDILPPGTVEVRILGSSDDAEQQISSGTMDLTSTDIEIGDDPGFNEDQLGGLRFLGVEVPQGATINLAYIEFTTDETDSVSTSVTIRAEDSDSSSAFTSTGFDIANRALTTSSVPWSNIPSWSSIGEKHTTPDLSPLVQEVVDRAGWANGNHMSFIIDGTGSRTSESFDGDSANAALLHIEYEIPAANNPPVAGNQSVSTFEDTPLPITLTASDADGDLLSYTVLTNVTSGILSGVAPNLIYTPNSGFFGNDSFDFKANDGTDDSNTATISITVNPVNEIPVAFSDNYSTQEDTELNVSSPGVLGNDTDADVEPLTALLDTDVSNGSLTLNGDGSFSYTPNLNFNGVDSFTYHANDGLDNSNTVTVTITVDPVNDAPTADAGGPYTGISGQPVSFVGDNSSDPDGDALSYLWDFGDGTTSTDANPTHTFTDAGPYTVTLVVNDGTVDSPQSSTTADISAPNNPPAADDQQVPISGSSVVIILTGSDADGDSLTFSIVSGPSDGRLSKKMTTISPTAVELTYTAQRNFAGSDSFTFLVNDGADDSNIATVLITEEALPNNPPTANDDSVTTTQNAPITINVLANDNDSDGDSLSIDSLDLAGTGGSVVINGDQIEYTPETDFIGVDSFAYTASDGTDSSNPATVTITVNEPLPETAVHVESIIGESSTKGPWNTATMTITVNDSSNNPVSGVVVSGSWGGYASGNDSCTTNSSGVCTVSDKSKNNGEISFTVNDLSGTNITYDSGSNVVSTGSIIVP